MAAAPGVGAVARAGGGIVSTVRATRSATDDDLLFTALPRVDALLDEGVTAIEVKSGYGLDIETELAMLSTARAIALARRVRVRTSFLGAHAVPPEYAGRPDAYIDEVCLPALEAIHSANLADAVDGFCEGIAFTPEQIRREYYHQARLMRLDDLTEETASEPLSTRLWRRYGAAAFNLLEEIRQDPAMGEVLIKGTEYIRCELHHAAKREMVTRLDDFLRRRSKIALIERTKTIHDAPGIHEACRILFGDNAQIRFEEYFKEHN